ncbi:hypothetical protein IFM89_002545 [Coptis chinensis]|uniref:Protein kinase domain-containing protein n=1 Tax=Coptis chinensis TaxID=261450 RepID=A0A835HKQ1_9MAGN|nr:hypothetical protein IFM89_002545 [Coptis chinensis]
MGRFLGTFELVWVILGVVFVTCDSFTSSEVWALTAFKEAIYEDPHFVLSNWNSLDSDPCNWSGIYCSVTDNHTLTLNLSGSSLKGFLAPELGLLTSLQELILPQNNLIGTIPKEIGMLRNLQVLDLGANQLSGPIPPEIGNLASTAKIYLQSNALTGRVPPEFGNLRNLVELRLDKNKLQGAVPANSSSYSSNMRGMFVSGGSGTGFCRSSQLKVADFSNNFFIGKIPECLNYLPRSSFQGNCFQDKNPEQRSAHQCGVTPPEKRHPSASNSDHRHAEHVKHQNASRPTWLLALEIATGTTVGFVLLFAIITALTKCKGKSPVTIPRKKASSGKDQMIIYIDPALVKDVKRWSRQELEVACEDFSNIIGSSPDSLVYKGVVKDGQEIAVISLCIKEEYWTGYLELYYQKEVADLARLNHENTGKLLGYCSESTPFSRMLVFEYTSNGTLYEHLQYGEGCQLSWARRMRIIIGIARGLKYLHTELNPPFVISELNSSAVYLTEDFSPKLVDFESWKAVFARSGKSTDSIRSGVICESPDSLEPSHLDIEANIFSFGVLLLEIISGRPSYCKDRGCLVDWARQYLELPEVMSSLVDPELKHFKYDDVKVICEVVNICLQPEPAKRSSMQVLFPMLESRIETSISAELRESPLAWAELALSS